MHDTRRRQAGRQYGQLFQLRGPEFELHITLYRFAQDPNNPTMCVLNLTAMYNHPTCREASNGCRSTSNCYSTQGADDCLDIPGSGRQGVAGVVSPQFKGIPDRTPFLSCSGGNSDNPYYGAVCDSALRPAQMNGFRQTQGSQYCFVEEPAAANVCLCPNGAVRPSPAGFSSECFPFSSNGYRPEL